MMYIYESAANSQTSLQILNFVPMRFKDWYACEHVVFIAFNSRQSHTNIAIIGVCFALSY